MGCETANYLYTRCPEVVSTNCITYQGESIDCLGVCKGMTLTKLEDIVVNKICNLATLTDATTTTVPACIIAAWNAGQEDKTILNLLQFALDQICVLQAEITVLQTPVEPEVTLDYDCCSTNSCVTTGKVTLSVALQNIINCICGLNTKIESFQTSIGDANIKAGDAIDIAQDALDTITAQQNAITALSTKIDLQKLKINEIITAASTSLVAVANLPLIP